MERFRLFFTIFSLITSLIIVVFIAIFDHTIFLRVVEEIKTYIWPAGIALVVFIFLLSAGVVSNLERSRESLLGNGYFQLAILELFLATAGLTYFRYYFQQPGDIILRLQPETTRAYIYLVIEHHSSGSVTRDTVRAPGKLYQRPPGRYSIDIIDQDIVNFHADVQLEPAETETLIIPVELNVKTLAVHSEPANADIWINGLQATTTPHTFEILTGDTVNLELKLSGYEAYTDTFRMEENVDLGVITLRKLYTVWVSSRYAYTEYRIYDMEGEMVFSATGSRKLQLAQGRYRIAYEIGEGQYESKTFLLNYNSTVMIP
jgi:hypothetical protein